MTQLAQIWFNNNVKNTTKKVMTPGGGKPLGANEVANPADPLATVPPTPKNELTGSLVIKDCEDLEEIKLDDNGIEELTIENCPNLKKINFSNNRAVPGSRGIKKINLDKLKVNPLTGEAEDNVLEEITIGKNDIEVIDVTRCKNLKKIYVQENLNIKEIRGIEELKNLKTVNIDNTDLRLVHKDVIIVIKEILGLNPADGLSDKLTNLRTEIENKVVSQKNPQLQTAKENAEKEAQQAKQELETVKTERDQLKQQLAEIRNELGLGEDATQQKILDEIKSLKNRPTSGCSHTDYDDIKAERDRLTSEVESKNRRISELENENKENIGITKEALTESTKSHFQKLGVKVPDESKLKNATTAQNVERIRNEIISSEFIKLKEENKSSFYLNLGLGAIALGSLILLAWVVMRQNDLPKEEPEKKKK